MSLRTGYVEVALNDVHSAAMAVKQAVFRAQDASSRAASSWDSFTAQQRRLHRKMEKRLARVRAELEQLDNDYLRARTP
jgi:hypothetical protein